MSKISSKDEQRWQAEEDARTLGRYQEIMEDKARLGRAVKIAKQQASDLNARAKALNKSITGIRRK